MTKTTKQVNIEFNNCFIFFLQCPMAVKDTRRNVRMIGVSQGTANVLLQNQVKNSLSHSLTYSLTNSFAHSLIRSLTHLLTLSLSLRKQKTEKDNIVTVCYLCGFLWFCLCRWLSRDGANVSWRILQSILQQL